MRLIKKIHEGEKFTSTIIGYKIKEYVDAKSLNVGIYLGFILIKIEFLIPKKREVDIF